MKKYKISVIIPTYNEEKVISKCLESILGQTYKNYEIIVVDDGSSDGTFEILSNFKNQNPILKVFKQKHKGAAEARNLGSKSASGEILVFVDADMEFDKEFLKNLIQPILEEKAIGTFSKDEYVLNKDNLWSRCWNINKNLPEDRMHSLNYPNEQAVFRAILRKEFEKVCGFDSIGYVDDHTLYQKLKTKALLASNAIFYHRNPENLKEVFTQAKWIGKSEFKLRKIKNENLMRLLSIVRYSLVFSLITGVIKAIKYKLPEFIIFKIIYDFAIEISLFKSFISGDLYK